MFVWIGIFNLLAVAYCSIQFGKSGKNYLYIVVALLLTALTVTYRLTGII